MRQNIFGRSIVGRAMEILLVEGNLDEARAALEVLDNGNVRCRVTLVRNGEEALAFLHRKAIFARAPRPDLIVLAAELPEIGDFSVSSHYVLSDIQSDESLKSIPVVVLSDEALGAPGAEASFGEVSYMPKPLAAEQFVSMVKNLHFSLLTQLVSSSY